MDKQRVLLLALAFLIVVVIAFFAVFRKKGKFEIETPLGKVTAEGSNEPRSEIQIENARAGRDIVAGAGSTDNVSVKGVEAGRDVRVTRRS